MPATGRAQHLRGIVRRVIEDGRHYWLLECGHRITAWQSELSNVTRSRRVICPECQAEGGEEPAPGRKEKRRCAHPGCDTILNSHNKGRLCNLHRDGSDDDLRRKP